MLFLLRLSIGHNDARKRLPLLSALADACGGLEGLLAGEGATARIMTSRRGEPMGWMFIRRKDPQQVSPGLLAQNLSSDKLPCHSSVHKHHPSLRTMAESDSHAIGDRRTWQPSGRLMWAWHGK